MFRTPLPRIWEHCTPDGQQEKDDGACPILDPDRAGIGVNETKAQVDPLRQRCGCAQRIKQAAEVSADVVETIGQDAPGPDRREHNQVIWTNRSARCISHEGNAHKNPSSVLGRTSERIKPDFQLRSVLTRKHHNCLILLGGAPGLEPGTR